jgi:hypothetical protein
LRISRYFSLKDAYFQVLQLRAKRVSQMQHTTK